MTRRSIATLILYLAAGLTGLSLPDSVQPNPAQGKDFFLEGRHLASSGKCRDAIPYFDQAIQARPRYAKAYSDRGRCFAMLGQLDRGLKDLDRAAELAPNDMSPYFNRASLRADAGDGDGALADLDQSVRNDPMNPASRAARAALFEVAGRAREAQLDRDTAYRQVETLAPKRRPIMEQVLKTWRSKQVRLSPSATQTGKDPIQAARAAIESGRYRAALAMLDAALLKQPGDEVLLLSRGRLLVELGQATQAVEDLTSVVQRYPSALAFIYRGLAYRQLCRFRDEIADYDQAVRLDSKFSQAYFERAYTTTFFDKRLDPVPDLTRVIELDPRNWLAYNLRGEDYRYWNKLSPAMADFQRVVALRPDFAQAYCNMAFALRAAGRMNEVDTWLQKCFALDPSEREVADKAFAKIQALEERAAREMAAMRAWAGPAPSSSGSSSSSSSSSGGGCSYTNYAACNAEKAGDRWAADRIERGTSSGSEKAWYGR